jgi:hypothetical protein
VPCRLLPGAVLLAIALPAAALLAPARAVAGGVEVGDQGAKAAGRGGAFAAAADDFTAVDFNPGALALIRGTHLFVNYRALYQDIEYRRARTLDWGEATHGVPELLQFDHVRPADPWYLMGMMGGVTTDFGLDDWGFALGAYGPSAVGSAGYPADGPQKYMLTNMDVVIIYYTAAVAWKYKNLFGLGASLQYVDCPQLDFELVVDGNIAPKLVHPDESPFDIRTSISGADRTGFTAILGGWYEPLRGLRFALSGRILPVHVETDSKLSVVAENLTLTKPPRITKDGVDDNNVHFSMDMPVKLKAAVRYAYGEEEGEGLRHRGSSGPGSALFDVELDVRYDLWSVMQEYTLDAGVDVEVMGHQVPIGKLSILKDWQDTFSAHLGSDVRLVRDVLWLRAGFFYETPTVKPGYEYMDAFAFERFAPSAGLSLKLFGTELAVAYTWVHQVPRVVNEEDSKVFQQVPGSLCQAPYTDVDSCNEAYLGKPSAPANAGTYTADFHLVNASLNVGF